MPYNNGIPVLASNLDFAMPGLQQLGGAIAHMVNPNREAQVMLKKKLQEDPMFRQQLIDMEAQNPGTISRMFGGQAAFLGEGTPSLEAQSAIYAKQNAAKSPDQWDASAASQAAQVKAGLGTKQAREATQGQIDYYALQRDKMKLDMEQEQVKYNAIKDMLPQAVRAEMEAGMEKNTRLVSDYQMASDAMKTFGGNREKLLNNLAQTIVTGKPSEGELIPFEYQTALMNADPGFNEQLQMRVRALQSDRDYSQRVSLLKFEKSSQEEMLARQQASAYMTTARQYGMNLDPNAIYKVFKVGFEKATQDPKLKPVLEQITRADQAAGSQYLGTLMSGLATFMQKINIADAMIEQKGKKAELNTQTIQNDIQAYNMYVQKLQEYSDFTGKPLNIPQASTKSISKFFGPDLTVLQYKVPTQSGNVRAGIDNIKADLASGKLTPDVIVNDTSLTQEEKDYILGKKPQSRK